MKAAFITRTGSPDVIEVGDLPDPVAGPRQAVVRVRACAVNPIDTSIRSGAISMPLPNPFIVGCDLAGEVVAVGSDVAGLRPGMRVWGSNQGLLGRQGTFAELAAVDEQIRAAAPAGVDVSWETQREPDFDRAVAVLAERGRLVIMAGRDARPAFPVGPFYVKGCTLVGFVMFKADAAEQAAAAADINRWLAAGRLRMPIDRVLPLARTAEAHAAQEAATVGGSHALAGKIVVEP